ncbi:HAD family hydrolase [Nocardioides sambongensis]|uniref:HAD family hydrolase n=1 Tax=Nocardioides sambongensis TaxID=2589074 RepID=UPI00112C3921|nr:HAD family hydrolase [Nocardioides sambongensis]
MVLPGAVDAVLFDLDDTLVDHRGAAERGLRTWLAGLGLAEDPIGLEEHVDRWFALEARHYERSQRGEITHTEQRRARIRAFLPGWDLADDALADDTFAGFLACYRSAWRAFSDAADAVRAARSAGLAVGILTNGVREIQESKLRRTGLAALGVPVFASSELPAAKPDSRSYHAACAGLDVEPSRCAMVGDSLVHDVHGAERAGLRPIWLDRAGRHDPARHGTPARVRRLADIDWSRARTRHAETG